MQARPEEAHDAAGIAEADLDVIEAAESGGGIDGLALLWAARIPSLRPKPLSGQPLAR